MASATFWWTLAGILLMLCEFAMPGLILFFFGLGAFVVAMVTWLIPLTLNQQIALMIIASVGSIFGLRRFLKPIFTGRSTARSEDALPEGLLGEEGVVSDPITPGVPGKIILHGTAWKAESEESLVAEDRVLVTGQNSLTLFVKKKQ